MDEEKQEGLLQNVESKELSKEDQVYISGLMKLLHSKKTAPVIDEMLSSGPPEQTIPQVALMVNDQMEKEVSKKKKVELETLLLGGMYLVSDLIELGNAGGIFQIEDEEQIRDITQATFQTYIERGLKDGSIDPIELQSKVEPLLNEQQKGLGGQLGGEHQVPTAPNEDTAMEVYGAQRERAGMLKGGQQNGI